MNHNLPPYSAIETALAIGMKEVATMLRDKLQYTAPQATGNFAMGLDTVLIFGSMDYSIFLLSTAEVPLLEWVVEGTQPHEIGNDGQFLYNPDEGFAAVGPVEHPGTEPNPFIADALSELEPDIIDVLTNEVLRAMME